MVAAGVEIDDAADMEPVLLGPLGCGLAPSSGTFSPSGLVRLIPIDKPLPAFAQPLQQPIYGSLSRDTLVRRAWPVSQCL
jgi:hypothetical protein